MPSPLGPPAQGPNQASAPDDSAHIPQVPASRVRSTFERLSKFRASVMRWVNRLSPTGVVFGVIAWCVSLAPSLIPREWLFQAVLSGLCVVIAYGTGSTIGGFVRWLGFTTPWGSRTKTVLWRVFIPVAIFSVVYSVHSGTQFQKELRVLFGLDPNAPVNFLYQVLVAGLVGILVLLLARLLRRVGYWVTHKLNKWIPYRASVLAAIVIVAVGFGFLIDGTLVRGAKSGLNTMYATSDKEIPEDVQQPQLSERSGSPQSLSPWDDLGFQGRAFVGTGPSKESISQLIDQTSALTGRAAKTPIRTYAGLTEERDLADTAAEVVAELDRTNAWEREALMVVTTTGTGWVDPALADSFEYLFAGDTAIASMQYSFLPSGVAFLADRKTPPQAGKALFEAVYAAWDAKPENQRPKLYVSGLSLGSYGMQGAFSGLQDINERTDGAVFVGTPNFTELWKGITTKRDPGSPEIQPIFDGGRQVRFSSAPNDASNVHDLPGPWKDPKVVYIQHGSDAVTWWSPDLIWNAPDWMSEAPAVDRPHTMRWYPVVTFLQLSFDMFVAGTTPPGHGHTYVREYADALAAISNQENWSEADLTMLKDFVQNKSSQDSL